MIKQIYNDDVERIVNPHTAKARRRANRKVNRQLRLIVLMLAAILAGLLMWLTGLIGGVGTAMAETAFACVAAFSAGRLYETQSPYNNIK